MVLYLGSWWFFSSNSYFIEPKHLSLSNTLLDENLIEVLGSGDLKLILLILFSCAASSLLIYSSASTIKNTKELLNALKDIFYPLTIVAILACSIQISTKASELKILQPILKRATAPHFAFFWGKALFGKDKDLFTKQELKLKPSYLKTDYQKQIKQDELRRNILLIVVEAFRSDALHLEIQNKQVTPTINRLAKEGHSFTRAYAHSPETAYSQFTLITGQYPLTNPRRNFNTDLNYSFAKIYDLLFLANYRNIYLTYELDATRRLSSSPSLELHFDPLEQVADNVRQFLPKKHQDKNNFKGYQTAATDKILSEVFINWISQHSQSKSNQPFFALTYLYATHFPYNPPNKNPVFNYDEIQTKPNFFSYSKEITSTMKLRYYNALNYIDSLIEKILEKLRSSNMLDNTSIIITGDHGELFNEHNLVTHAGSLYEEALKVPVIIWNAEKKLQPTKGYNQAVGHISIAPTILSLANLPEYHGHQGFSLLSKNDDSLLTSRTNPIFSTVQVMTHEDSVILMPWKYVKNHNQNQERLYNLEKDPTESFNLANSQPKTAARLNKLLEEYRNSQLSYYAMPKRKRLDYFPPRYQHQ